ncbi:MAG TPA: hypothetical protein PLM71_10455 [Syntrophorhabdaceae bacterium]|nr:hypothetical protein [Syntrophorhabdaceae bacterium]HPU30723.1 hypothetical protein [Syntrophorhabdaceae bacterium]
MEKTIVYVELNSLLGLSKVLKTQDLDVDEQEALKNIWTLFNEEKIRLVTSGDDIKMDIIMWLNNQGCCVTDTLTPIEAIKEFEKWEKADKNILKAWRRIFYYYDRIESIPKQYNDNSAYIKVLPWELLSVKSGKDPDFFLDNLHTVKEILKDCANGLSEIFPQEKWHDLSCIDYQLNWMVLERTFKKLGIELDLEGSYGEEIKRIFGLLNRVINLSKKSSKNPKLNPEHLDFIINTVINKYFTEKSSYIKHIMNCISYGIEYMLTTDKKFIERFRKIKKENTEKFKLLPKKFNLLTPCELQSELFKNKNLFL